MAKNQSPEEKQLAQVNEAAANKAEENKQQAEELQDKADQNQKESAVPKTDTVAKIDAASDDAVENAADAKAQASGVSNLGQMATSTDWSIDDHNRRTNPNDVKFNVTNPKKTGLQKGIIVVSREVADDFESNGYGKIVK